MGLSIMRSDRHAICFQAAPNHIVSGSSTLITCIDRSSNLHSLNQYTLFFPLQSNNNKELGWLIN